MRPDPKKVSHWNFLKIISSSRSIASAFIQASVVCLLTRELAAENVRNVGIIAKSMEDAFDLCIPVAAGTGIISIRSKRVASCAHRIVSKRDGCDRCLHLCCNMELHIER
jgi:hypothetical protein